MTREEELLTIVSDNAPEDYNRIAYEKGDLFYSYHLSHVRANVIEWLPITKEDTVLEIGAQCGALTGTLAAMAGHVTCTEQSAIMSQINERRHRNLTNIEYCQGSRHRMKEQIQKQYDYVLMIGAGHKDQDKLIQFAKARLKKGGKLVLAVNNRIGLKYLAGGLSEEEHTLYSSVEEIRPGERSTFSKDELIQLLEANGMKQYEFYYPYPDYIYTTSVYSDQYLPKVGELRNTALDMTDERVITFEEGKVFDTLIKNGGFPVLANSFLVIASDGE